MGMKREKVSLKQPTSFTVIRKGQPVVVDTNDPYGKTLTEDCISLLSLEVIQKLGIDLNYHASFDTHKHIKYLDDLTEVDQQNERSLNELLEEFVQPLTAKDMVSEVNLSETVIQ